MNPMEEIQELLSKMKAAQHTLEQTDSELFEKQDIQELITLTDSLKSASKAILEYFDE